VQALLGIHIFCDDKTVAKLPTIFDAAFGGRRYFKSAKGSSETNLISSFTISKLRF
jgi:hypothetical protein